MFWFSYDVISIRKEEDIILYNPENWEKCNFQYKNKEFLEYAKYAFCGGSYPFVKDNKISMRALNLGSTFSESLLIFCIKTLDLMKSKNKF